MQEPSLSIAHHTASFNWLVRLRAATIHLGLSALVAVLAGLLVFALWYPFPYRELSGGRELFLLVVSVDVTLGPLITFAIFNLRKPRAELKRDLAVVALLQLAGLAYGLWTVQLARPVHMVFEYDRFRVVHRTDIPLDMEDRIPPALDVGLVQGPTLLALRPFRDASERMEFTVAALGGVSLAARPELWQPYEAGREQVLRAAHPVAELKSRFPQRAADIDEALRQAGADARRAAYLPLVGRRGNAWTVLLDGGTAQPLAYLPLDSF